jgi:hypothetical protein
MTVSRRVVASIAELTTPVILLTALWGCSSPTSPDADAGADATADGPSTSMVCAPAPSTTRVVGDFNSDGAWDFADSVAFSNFLFRGGHAAGCQALVDFRVDGHLEIDDASALRGALVSGIYPAPGFSGRCIAMSAWTDGPCVELGAAVRAPAQAPPGRFDAQLTLTSGAAIVQGWSASIRATGCRIVAITTAATAAADVSDAPPGLRHLGSSVTQLTAEGAVVATELSLSEDRTLPSGTSTVATLTVEAPAAAGCAECALTVGDGLRWTGRELTLTVAAGGYGYHPPSATSITRVCAP